MGYGKQTEIANVTLTADFDPDAHRLRQVILQTAQGAESCAKI